MTFSDESCRLPKRIKFEPVEGEGREKGCSACCDEEKTPNKKIKLFQEVELVGKEKILGVGSMVGWEDKSNVGKVVGIRENITGE